MAYVPVYQNRINWENEPSIVSPINATNLNKMDYALKAHDDTLATWDITKANESDLLLALKDVTYDTDTGEFVFTWWNGTTKTVDLNIEKIPVSFSMDANGVITMTTEDGTSYTADVGALIKTYTFTDSSEIDFTVTTDASGNKTIVASIVAGSIDGTKLVPNYLADCTAAKTGAETAEGKAEGSAEDAEAWAVGTRGGVPVPSTDPTYENNAEWWATHTSSSFAGLTDTDINNPQNGQVPVYNSTSGKWENQNQSAGGGSTIVVTTSESAFYGQNVTLSDGVTTLTETFDNAGVATFSGVTLTGSLTIASGAASTSLNVPYFGNYTAVISSFSATITVTYPGGTCTCVGNGESYTASSSPYTFTVHGAATYTITNTIDGVSKTDTVTITTDGQSESVTISFGTINVTYDNDFRGTSITCTQGGTTITKTAPSAGNTMSFYPPTTGTWVISGTVSGDTYNVNATVSSLSTPVPVTLETIPDGSTTTPTDDIQKWLACAGIRDKAYTTLSQVLSDSETFNALLGDSNACAYMARSTTWAIATGLVPVMTDDTHPSGTASASSYESGYEAYKAFDGDDSTYWVALTLNNYIQYEFDTPTRISKIKAMGYDVNNCFHTVELYGVNNGDATKIADLSFDNVATLQTRDVDCDTAYSAYRFKVTSDYGTNITNSAVKTLQFFPADITTSQYAMSMIGQYDVCCDALLGNATWASAICASNYADYIFNGRGLVPTMTSNTTPSGVASASSIINSTYDAYRAFDGTSTNWASTNNDGQGAYIQYQFIEPKIIKAVSANFIVGSSDAPYASSVDWILKASNDGTDFDDHILATSVKNGVNADIYTPVNNDTAFLYYRLVATSANYSQLSDAQVGRLQFYGSTGSREYIHGTNNEVAYYLDGATQTPIVDPSTLSAGTYTFGSTVAKDPSDLTADYTKTIRITPNTKEIVVRPDNALYWYGYINAGTEQLTNANGWSFNGTWSAPGGCTYTINTNNIYMLDPGGTHFTGFSNKNDIALNGKTIKAIVELVANSSVDPLAVMTFASDKATYSNVTIPSGSGLVTINSVGASETHCAVVVANGREGYMEALWYE